MTISLKEYCGYSVDSNGINAPIRFKEAVNPNFMAPKPDTLMVEVEGIHAYPFHTRNYTRYMPEALKNSQKKWTTPYLRPLIKHHNDQNGEIIGRIYDAKYVEKTGVQDISGLLFTVSVPDEKAAKDVENRILDTVSIGVEANDVRCSICGKQITDAREGCPNGHHRGMLYEGETCYWDVYDIEPKELSYVIVPSDIYAMNKKTYRAKDNNKQYKEFEDRAAHFKLNEADTPVEDPENNSGGNNPDMDLEKQLAEVQAKVEELKKQLETKTAVEQENAELKSKNEELQKAVDDAKEALDKVTSEKKAVEDELKTSKEDLTIATQEKEAAETAGAAAQENYKMATAEMLNLYRTVLNKAQLDEAKIQERSIESLKDSVNDLKEEYGEILKNKQVVDLTEGKNKIGNPVPPANGEPKKTTPNPEYTATSLRESVLGIFTSKI